MSWYDVWLICFQLEWRSHFITSNLQPPSHLHLIACLIRPPLLSLPPIKLERNEGVKHALRLESLKLERTQRMREIHGIVTKSWLSDLNCQLKCHLILISTVKHIILIGRIFSETCPQCKPEFSKEYRGALCKHGKTNSILNQIHSQNLCWNYDVGKLNSDWILKVIVSNIVFDIKLGTMCVQLIFASANSSNWLPNVTELHDDNLLWSNIKLSNVISPSWHGLSTGGKLARNVTSTTYLQNTSIIYLQNTVLVAFLCIEGEAEHKQRGQTIDLVFFIPPTPTQANTTTNTHHIYFNRECVKFYRSCSAPWGSLTKISKYFCASSPDFLSLAAD